MTTIIRVAALLAVETTTYIFIFTDRNHVFFTSLPCSEKVSRKGFTLVVLETKDPALTCDPVDHHLVRVTLRTSQ
jgi:hypothetical protein